MYSLVLHGRRSLIALQKWRNLRVSVTLFQNGSAFSNSFSSAGASLEDGRKGKTFTVSYLVDSLGFTTKLAESISRKLISEGNGNPDSVLSLLRDYGFTDPQISTIVASYPPLLTLDAEKSLAPKLNFLQSRGASTSELTEILSKFPKILGMKEDKVIVRYYGFVKDIIEADKSSSYEMSCLSSPQGTRQDNIIRNVLVLRELGVPQRLLLPLLVSNRKLVSGKERFEESLKKIVDMGFDPTTSKFVKALCVVYQMSDKTIQEKVGFYKRLGFSEGDVWDRFKKNPQFLALSEKNVLNSIETFLGVGFSRDEIVLMAKRFSQCLNLSAESVKSKTEFLVEKMNWPIKALVSNPAVFGYSLEKRTVPRCNVVKALMSKGLLGDKLLPLSRVLAITDQAFLNKFVKIHDDEKLVRELMAIFTRGLVS